MALPINVAVFTLSGVLTHIVVQYAFTRNIRSPPVSSSVGCRILDEAPQYLARDRPTALMLTTSKVLSANTMLMVYNVMRIVTLLTLLSSA